MALNADASVATIRVVFDTSVVLQGALNNNGPSALSVAKMDSGVVATYISNYVRAEYERTLFNAGVRRKNSQLTDTVGWAMLARFDLLATRLDRVPARFYYRRDPKDEPFINLAIHVQAHYLVTRNRDLLDLAGNTALLALAPDLQILAPLDFLAALQNTSP